MNRDARLGSSAVGSGISMAVADRARETPLSDSPPGISFLVKWELEGFFFF